MVEVSPPSLLALSPSPGGRGNVKREKVRWNVNDRHFLSAAFYHRPGSDGFDMSPDAHCVCPEEKIIKNRFALCVNAP